MEPDNLDEMRRQAREREAALRAARQVLGVAEDASESEVRSAWRQACLRYHPDRNPEGHDRYVLLECAYRLLTEGRPCPALEKMAAKSKEDGKRSDYDLDNPWGMFLWWRDRFF